MYEYMYSVYICTLDDSSSGDHLRNSKTSGGCGLELPFFCKLFKSRDSVPLGGEKYTAKKLGLLIFYKLKDVKFGFCKIKFRFTVHPTVQWRTFKHGKNTVRKIYSKNVYQAPGNIRTFVPVPLPLSKACLRSTQLFGDCWILIM